MRVSHGWLGRGKLIPFIKAHIFLVNKAGRLPGRLRSPAPYVLLLHFVQGSSRAYFFIIIFFNWNCF